MMFYPLALLGGIALFSSAAAKTVWDVEVSDKAADLVFLPPITHAEPGDFVRFHFNPKNHSVTQSSFAQPCTPLKGGFNSGFFPVGVNDTIQPTFTIVVNDSSPIWIHCEQAAGTNASHCGNGMVAAINPGAIGSNDSFTGYLRNALKTIDLLSTPPSSNVTVSIHA